MLKVFKYTIPVTPTFELDLPEGAEILHLDSQYGRAQMWVLVRESNPLEKRRFVNAGTGHDIDRGYDELIFLGMIKLQEETFILHVFEETNDVQIP